MPLLPSQEIETESFRRFLAVRAFAHVLSQAQGIAIGKSRRNGLRTMLARRNLLSDDR